MRTCLAALLFLLFTHPLTASENTLRVRLYSEPSTLDWHLAYSGSSRLVIENIMEGMMSIDDDLRLSPCLAKEVKISRDGKTLTFSLRKNVKWSDGVTLVAQHFADAWRRLLEPTTGSPDANILFDIQGAQEFHSGKTPFERVGIRVLSSHQIQVTLKKAYRDWPRILTSIATYPFREDLYKRYGSKWTDSGNLVTLGPFLLKSFDLSDKLILTTQPYYSEKRGNLDQVIIQIVNDDTTAIHLFQTGKLDIAPDLSTEDLSRFADSPELKSYPILATHYLGFVVDGKTAIDIHLRKAIAMAIDKKEIARILKVPKLVASSLIPISLSRSSKTIGLPFNPKAARLELKASTYKPGTNLELGVGSFQETRKLAEILAHQIKNNLGVTVSIQGMENKAARASRVQLSYPLFVTSIAPDFPDSISFLQTFQTGTFTGWKSKSFDRLLEQGSSSKDSKLFFQDAQKLLIEQEAVIVPLYNMETKVLIQKRVQGFRPRAFGALLFKELSI